MTKWLLRRMIDSMGPRAFEVRLWDGDVWPAEGDEAAFSVHVKTPRLAYELLSRPSLVTFGKAYVEGDLDIDGDLEAAFRVGERWLNGNKPSLFRRALHAWSARPALGRDIRALLGVKSKQLAVIHLVNLIPSENHDEFRLRVFEHG